MSEEDRSQDHEAHTKLSFPKFLEGEEDAEVTWEIIKRRYPNVAPLLCQMETAISRAENLLQELGSPCIEALGNSSTFHISNSLEEIHPDQSLSSYRSQEVQEDFPEINVRHSNDVNGYRNRYSIRQNSKTIGVEVQVTEEYFFPEEDVNAEYITSKSIDKDIVEEEEIKIISPKGSIQDESDDRKKREDDGQESVKNIEDSPKIFTPEDDERSTKNDRNAKNTSSLEAWARVVGEEVMQSLYPTTESALMLNQNQEDHHASLPSTAEKRKDSNELQKKCFSSKNNPLHQVITVQGMHEEETSVTHVKTISTVSKVVDNSKEFEAELKTDKKNLMERIINQPEVLLSVIENKPDGEFQDQSPRRLKNSKTNEADNQGSGDESIISSGSASDVIKLYKLCEKEKAPEPIFIVNQEIITGGLKYNATCKALDLISYGSGKSVVKARRKAAKALMIQKYREISKNPSREN